MYSPPEFLVEVNKVAKAYPGADKHVTAIRNALDISKNKPPQQRLLAIERALVGGLMTKSFRNNGHMSSLTKAWHKYKQWHHKHARKAYAVPKRTHAVPKAGLRQLPAHLFDAEIARRLSTSNLESLARAAKTNNPAVAPLEIRREAFEGELRALTELGAILLQVPAEHAVEIDDDIVDGKIKGGYNLSAKCIVRDIPGGRLQYVLTGTNFRALHTITKDPTFLIQSMKDKSTGKYVSLVRMRYVSSGSSRAKTMITSHGFMPSWTKIVRDAVEATKKYF